MRFCSTLIILIARIWLRQSSCGGGSGSQKASLIIQQLSSFGSEEEEDGKNLNLPHEKGAEHWLNFLYSSIVTDALDVGWIYYVTGSFFFPRFTKEKFAEVFQNKRQANSQRNLSPLFRWEILKSRGWDEQYFFRQTFVVIRVVNVVS